MGWKVEGKIGMHFPHATINNFDTDRIVFNNTSNPDNNREIEYVVYIPKTVAEEIKRLPAAERVANAKEYMVWRRYWEDAPGPEYVPFDGEMRIIWSNDDDAKIFKWSFEKKINDVWIDVNASLDKTNFWFFNNDTGEGATPPITSPIKNGVRELNISSVADGNYYITIQGFSKADGSTYPANSTAITTYGKSPVITIGEQPQPVIDVNKIATNLISLIYDNTSSDTITFTTTTNIDLNVLVGGFVLLDSEPVGTTYTFNCTLNCKSSDIKNFITKTSSILNGETVYTYSVNKVQGDTTYNGLALGINSWGEQLAIELITLKTATSDKCFSIANNTYFQAGTLTDTSSTTIATWIEFTKVGSQY